MEKPITITNASLDGLDNLFNTLNLSSMSNDDLDRFINTCVDRISQAKQFKRSAVLAAKKAHMISFLDKYDSGRREFLDKKASRGKTHKLNTEFSEVKRIEYWYNKIMHSVGSEVLNRLESKVTTSNQE